jgi:hypothetical protein
MRNLRSRHRVDKTDRAFDLWSKEKVLMRTLAWCSRLQYNRWAAFRQWHVSRLVQSLCLSPRPLLCCVLGPHFATADCEAPGAASGAGLASIARTKKREGLGRSLAKLARQWARPV